MTLTPVRFSLVILFNLSSPFCCRVLIGLLVLAIRYTPRQIMGTQPPMTMDRVMLVRMTMNMLMMIIIGVSRAVRRMMLMNCIRMNASLVVLVIMLDMPNLLYSVWENSWALRKISLRISLVTRELTRELQ